MPRSCTSRDTCMRPGSKYNATSQFCPHEGRPTMPQPTRPRIAFLAAGFIQWPGGLDFLRLCVGGIDSVLPDTAWPVLVPDDTASQRALAFAVAAKRRLFSLAGVQPPETPPVSNDHMRDALASANYNIDIQSYYGSPRGLSRAMGTLDAQVVLPSMMSLGPHFPHPWIGYIGDVQHKRLPGKFFIISNQFWMHKSHQTAFDALRLIRDAGFADVHILCTGNLHDYRAPC